MVQHKQHVDTDGFIWAHNVRELVAEGLTFSYQTGPETWSSNLRLDPPGTGASLGFTFTVNEWQREHGLVIRGKGRPPYPSADDRTRWAGFSPGSKTFTLRLNVPLQRKLTIDDLTDCSSSAQLRHGDITDFQWIHQGATATNSGGDSRRWLAMMLHVRENNSPDEPIQGVRSVCFPVEPRLENIIDTALRAGVQLDTTAFRLAADKIVNRQPIRPDEPDKGKPGFTMALTGPGGGVGQFGEEQRCAEDDLEKTDSFPVIGFLSTIHLEAKPSEVRLIVEVSSEVDHDTPNKVCAVDTVLYSPPVGLEPVRLRTLMKVLSSRSPRLHWGSRRIFTSPE